MLSENAQSEKVLKEGRTGKCADDGLLDSQRGCALVSMECVVSGIVCVLLVSKGSLF